MRRHPPHGGSCCLGWAGSLDGAAIFREHACDGIDRGVIVTEIFVNLPTGDLA